MAPQKTRYQKKENLIFAGIVLFILSIFIVTGIVKYNQSQDRVLYAKAEASLANNACPGCGQWGNPACPYCRYGMQWNNTQGLYVCPRCQMRGTTYCPSCMRPVPMQPQGAINTVPQNPGFYAPQQYAPQQNGALLVA